MDKFVDFVFFINGEKQQGYGEDAYIAELNGNKALLGVFDGCGGIGSRKYPEYDNMTGAYIASRTVRDIVKNQFKMDRDIDGDTLKAEILKGLKALSLNENRLKGDMQKAFPTTLSVITLRSEKRYILADFFWTGDSRGYLLEETGLVQISRDDILGGGDAFENLSEDARLSNYVYADGDFVINRRSAKINRPCAFISATDGCFAYFKTPMEFEYMLTETLMKSENENEWKKALEERIESISGDDFSLCLCCFGFKKFKKLKKAFKDRNKYLENNYIFPAENGKNIRELWESYKDDYYA